MPAHPLDPTPAPGWGGMHPQARSQLIPCLRAGLIALVLLVVFALIVLF